MSCLGGLQILAKTVFFSNCLAIMIWEVCLDKISLGKKIQSAHLVLHVIAGFSLSKNLSTTFIKMSDLYPRSGYTGSNLENAWHEQEILSPMQVLKQAQLSTKMQKISQKKVSITPQYFAQYFFLFLFRQRWVCGLLHL